jgi:acetamidase/formamidase
VRSKELETGTPGLVHHSRSAGLLPDDFPDPYIRVFDLTNGEFAYLRDAIAIPIEPFFGTMGACPAGAKEQANARVAEVAEVPFRRRSDRWFSLDRQRGGVRESCRQVLWALGFAGLGISGSHDH